MVVLAVAATAVLASFYVGQMRGEKNGRSKCEATYERSISESKDQVILELEEIRKQQKADREAWAKERDALEQQITADVDSEEKVTVKYVERLIEVPIPVSGSCDDGYDIGYDELFGVLDDAALGASARNN